MSWNYRIGTFLYSYKDTFPDNPILSKKKDKRMFSIIEVLYDKDGNPNGYSDEVNPTTDWTTLEDLVLTVDKLKECISKPIIDIDNFPNEWQIVLPG